GRPHRHGHQRQRQRDDGARRPHPGLWLHVPGWAALPGGHPARDPRLRPPLHKSWPGRPAGEYLQDRGRGQGLARQAAGLAAVPIAWKIVTEERMVLARADGPVTLQDIIDYLDAVVVADAQPYAKLFDTGTMQLRLSDNELMELGARMSAYSG